MRIMSPAACRPVRLVVGELGFGDGGGRGVRRDARRARLRQARALVLWLGRPLRVPP